MNIFWIKSRRSNTCTGQVKGGNRATGRGQKVRQLGGNEVKNSNVWPGTDYTRENYYEITFEC